MGLLSLWPHLLQLISLFQPYWPSSCSSSKLAHSCLRAFAQAVPAAWKVLLSDIHMAHSPAPTSVRSYITFSDTQTSLPYSFPLSLALIIVNTVELAHPHCLCWFFLGVSAPPQQGSFLCSGVWHNTWHTAGTVRVDVCCAARSGSEASPCSSPVLWGISGGFDLNWELISMWSDSLLAVNMPPPRAASVSLQPKLPEQQVFMG